LYNITVQKHLDGYIYIRPAHSAGSFNRTAQL